MPLTLKYGDRASGSAVANGAGVASVILNGPPRGWIDVDSIAITATPGTPIPVAVAYDGSTAALGRVLATIRAGDAGVFRGTNDRLNAGSQITVIWTGAAPGAVCRAILRGTEHS